MKDIAEREAEYFNFLWDASKVIIDEYFFKKYPEIGAYVQPRGAASCLMIGAHYAVLRQRDELFGDVGEFDEYGDDAAEIDRYIEDSMNEAAAQHGLPSDLYQKMIGALQSSINPDAMWLLSDMGGGGKKGRVIAIHSQIGNCLCNSFFRQRGASVIEMGDAGNVLCRLFATCYTKYAEILGFNEADYDETLRVKDGSRDDRARPRPKIDSLDCPENPFVSSLVEHVTSAELSSWGHDAPKPSATCGWAVDFFNEYFYNIDAGVREVQEGDVRDYCEELDGFVSRFAPEVIKRYLEGRENYDWSFGLRKGEMVVSILREIWGEDKSVEERILEMTNDFIENFPCAGYCDDELEDMID